MSTNSKIEWTDHTFNPWTGCTKVSPGCDHCYAEGWAKRSGTVRWGAGEARRRTTPQNWRVPIKWNAQADVFAAQHGRRQRVFCASLADVFDNAVDPTWRAELFALIAGTPNLDWLLLTKRIGNVASMIDAPGMQKQGLPPNVWLGATVVNQEEADRDIPKLLATPAAVRFLSMEPLLGPVDLGLHLFACCGNYEIGAYYMGQQEQVCCGRPDTRDALHWVIAGGESGPGARPSHPDWYRSLRDQCEAAGVPFLFKQWGEWSPGYFEHGNDMGYAAIVDAKQHEWPEGHCAFKVGKKAAGRMLDGREWNGVPE